MPLSLMNGRRWIAAALLVLVGLFTAQAALALAAGSETYAAPQVVAQAATATPFRFLTPTPFVSRPATTTTTTTSPAPRAGGIPLELIVPALAGGAAAIGGGTFLLRRRGGS